MAESGLDEPKEKLLVGSEDWLFLANDKNDSVGQYTGATPLPDRALDAWRRTFANLSDLSEQSGFRYVHLFAPSKESVYDANYPYRLERAAVRPIDKVLAAAGPFALYPVEELRRDGPMRTYDQGDSHWNDHGALRAAQAVLQKAFGDASALDPEAFEFSEAPARGDLDSKLPVSRKLPRITASPRAPRARLTFDSEVKNRGRTLVYEAEGAPLGAMLLFGDSFAWNLVTFFKETFRRLVFIHSTSADRSVIEREKPDLLLMECTERFCVEGPWAPERFRIADVVRLKFQAAKAAERVRLAKLYEGKLKDSPEAFYARLFVAAVE